EMRDPSLEQELALGIGEHARPRPHVVILPSGRSPKRAIRDPSIPASEWCFSTKHASARRRRCLGIFRTSGNRLSERKCTSIESGALFGNSASSASTQTKSALIGGEIEDAAPFEKILPLPGNCRPGASAPPRGWTMSEWRAEINRKSLA